MPRLPLFTPDQLDAAQRALYDAIVDGPRGSGSRRKPLTDEQGRISGPFNAMLLSPGLGQVLQELGAAVRYRTSLTDRAREIATLLVAKHADGRYEWSAHAHLGRAAGLTDDEIDALATGTWHFADPLEQAVAVAARELLASGDLTDEHYAQATQAMGASALFELLTLIGYYRLLALQLRVFGVDDTVDPIP